MSNWFREILPAAVVLTIVSLSASEGFGQTNSLFGNRGPTGQGNTGTAGGFGNTGLGGGTGSFGGLGATGGGLTGQGAGLGAGTNLGALAPSGAFIGRGTDPSTFIGRAITQGADTGAGTAGGGTRDFGQSGNRGGRQGGNGAGGRNGGGSSGTVLVRPQWKLAFDVPQPSVAEANSEVQASLSRIVNRDDRLAGVQVSVDDAGKATLTGTVDTPEARRLSELLIRFEPGIRAVDNQLTIAD